MYSYNIKTYNIRFVNFNANNKVYEKFNDFIHLVSSFTYENSHSIF